MTKCNDEVLENQEDDVLIEETTVDETVDEQPAAEETNEDAVQDEFGLANASYDDLARLQEATQKSLAAKRQRQREADLNTIKVLVAKHSFNAKDIDFPKGRRSTGPVKPKYRNPETGETWTGRGRSPLWIAEYSKEDREQFLIQN